MAIKIIFISRLRLTIRIWSKLNLVKKTIGEGKTAGLVL